MALYLNSCVRELMGDVRNIGCFTVSVECTGRVFGAVSAPYAGRLSRAAYVCVGFVVVFPLFCLHAANDRLLITDGVRIISDHYAELPRRTRDKLLIRARLDPSPFSSSPDPAARA